MRIIKNSIHNTKGNKMKALVQGLIERLVDKPEQVSVTERIDNGAIKLKVKVAEDDLGKVIGKKGQNISAIRTLVIAIGAKEKGKRVFVDLDED